MIKERIKKYLEAKRLSVREFERACGLGNGVVSRISKTTSPATLNKIASHSDLNIDWLLTGEGEMLAEVKAAAQETEEAVAGIPLLDIDASAGFSLVEPGGSGEGRTLSLPGCDGAIPVRGHSMEPEIHDGDIAGFVMLPSAASIRPDGIYIVQYDDAEGFRHVTIKRTKRSPLGEAYVRLASVNEDYGHEDVPLAAITRAAKVRFTLSILSY